MWTMLAGVPGKLKTILDRITAVRAGLLDNLTALDVAVSSRAPASTALSTANWTNAIAARLALFVAAPPASNFFTARSKDWGFGAPESWPAAYDNAQIGNFVEHGTSDISVSGTTTVLDYSGSGVLHALWAYTERLSVGGSYSEVSVRVTIDGVAHTSPARIKSGSGSDNRKIVFCGGVNFNEPIVFSSQLKIEIIKVGSSGSVLGTAGVLWRRQ